MESLAISNVIEPKRILCFVSAQTIDPTTNLPSGEEKRKLEVYTGWLRLGDDGWNAGGRVGGGTFVSFLCPEKNFVQPYKDDIGDIEWTVTAAPSSVSPKEDEANLFAVDLATVELKNQAFPGIPADQSKRCLLLKAHLGGMNTTINAITYQVTVLSSAAQKDQVQKLEVDEKAVPTD